ncbi:HNH endonuclease signature motif containing protein [Gordonia caeni]|uniref:HNH endonuclease signature motif containing protein n=1 Tax=Gordonia caeni TaxID=1007097 RepID=A0ABP7P282_9ACTN
MTAFADRLADDLTSPPDDGDDGGGLAAFLEGVRPVDDDRELLAVMAGLIRLRNIVDHALVRGIETAERTGVPGRKRVRSGANLLMELGMVPGSAHRVVRLGRAVAAVPQVARGMRDGAVPAELGDAVVRGLEYVARRIDVPEADQARVLASLMVQTTPAKVDEKARAWALRLTPAEPDDEGEAVPVAENIDLNEMTVVQGEDGRVSVTVDLDVVAGEELHAALDPLCRPVPEPDGSPDRRSAERRRADALAQMVRTYLAGSERPVSGGVLPHVSLVVPAWVTRNGRPILDREQAGEATVMVPVDLEAELARVPALGFTGPVSARTAELVMCDASVCAALIDGEGVPLSVGRDNRLFPVGIRKALAIRDRGCAFPGCGAAVGWCDAHHVEHWEHGGDTCLGNGVLLCRRHHTLIHHSGWEVFIERDGHPWFLPPVDPEHPNRIREPLRSHGRRTLTCLPTAAA